MEVGGEEHRYGAPGPPPVILVLPRAVLEGIEGHLESAYPREGCGVLLGEADGRVRRAGRHVPAENRADDRDRRYLVDPRTLRELLEAEGQGGPAVVGFYHSHPEGGPEPSPTDRELAWPWYAYLVVPVRDGRAGRAAVWSFGEEEGGGGVEGEIREVRER